MRKSIALALRALTRGHITNRTLILAMALLLAACGTRAPGTSFDTRNAFRYKPWHPSEGESVIVIGVKVLQRQGTMNLWPDIAAGWINVDPQTHVTTNPPLMAVMRLNPTAINQRFEFSVDRAPMGEMEYVVLALRPGHYALAWLERGSTMLEHWGQYYMAAHFERLYISQSHRLGQSWTDSRFFYAPARAEPYAPSFEVRPNETVYVGDIVFDLRNEGMLTWTPGRDDRTAARALTTGERLAPGMVVRPLRRIDGGELLPSDHAPFVPLNPA